MRRRRRKLTSSGDPSKVIGYIRTSTAKQDLSPAAQRKALQRWCREHDAELAGCHEDIGVSGGADVEDRPGLLAALDDVRDHGAGVLLVARRDRLARDVVVGAMCERLAQRNGAKLLTASGTGNGDGPEAALMRGLVDLFAAYERAIIRKRIKVALAVKQERGERTGGIPFGFRLGRDGKKLLPVKKEQDIIKQAKRLRSRGHSYQTIADRLTGKRRFQRNGKPFHAIQIARMLRRYT
jgi:DNA invertase Pin-like site-specific DNA recombinase